MKKVFLIVVVALCASLLISAASTNVSDTITDFYSSYISNAVDNKISDNDKLLATYMSESLITKVNKTKTERFFDPILNAQDCSRESIETISVVNVIDHWYSVSYKFSNSYTTILLHIKPTDRGIIIDNLKLCNELR